MPARCTAPAVWPSHFRKPTNRAGSRVLSPASGGLDVEAVRLTRRDYIRGERPSAGAFRTWLTKSVRLLPPAPPMARGPALNGMAGTVAGVSAAGMTGLTGSAAGT